MSNNVTVNPGDSLIKIVKREYGLTNNTDVMNAVNLIKKENNLKNVNLITVGQELKLPEQLRLNNVTIFGENNEEVLKPNQKNYYRANDVFGDTATKKQEFPNEGFVESALNLKTKATKFVTCQNGHQYCFICLQKWHPDSKCEEIVDKDFQLWAKDKVIKICPKCNYYV